MKIILKRQEILAIVYTHRSVQRIPEIDNIPRLAAYYGGINW